MRNTWGQAWSIFNAIFAFVLEDYGEFVTRDQRGEAKHRRHAQEQLWTMLQIWNIGLWMMVEIQGLGVFNPPHRAAQHRNPLKEEGRLRVETTSVERHVQTN